MAVHPAHTLLGVASLYAPNDAARGMLIKICDDMLSANETLEAVALAMARILVDGLGHNNWPWNAKKSAAFDAGDNAEDLVDCPCGCGDCRTTCRQDCGDDGVRCPDGGCLGLK